MEVCMYVCMYVCICTVCMFVEVLKQFHHNMKARVNVNGSLSELVSVENGVKQGDTPAPTLFSIYFAVMLEHAFKDCDIGIYIHFRTSGKVFNLRRFNSKSKTFQIIVRELFFMQMIQTLWLIRKKICR